MMYDIRCLLKSEGKLKAECSEYTQETGNLTSLLWELSDSNHRGQCKLSSSVLSSAAPAETVMLSIDVVLFFKIM